MSTLIGKEFELNGKNVRISTDYSKFDPNKQFVNLVYVDEPNKSAGQMTIEDLNKILKNDL